LKGFFSFRYPRLCLCLAEAVGAPEEDAGEGKEVTRAENGQAGVDLFAASPEGFFYSILMDLRMPVLDGYAAAKVIRMLKRSDAPGIPIIALSADAFEENKKMASEAGMTGYLTKPIDPAKLVMELSKK